jgi:hypothetical protein
MSVWCWLSAMRNVPRDVMKTSRRADSSRAQEETGEQWDRAKRPDEEKPQPPGDKK